MIPLRSFCEPLGAGSWRDGPKRRFIVDFMLAAGCDVTVFNSGRHDAGVLFAGQVERLYGDPLIKFRNLRDSQVAGSESLPSMFAIRARFRATAVRVAQSWFLAFPM